MSQGWEGKGGEGGQRLLGGQNRPLLYYSCSSITRPGQCKKFFYQILTNFFLIMGFSGSGNPNPASILRSGATLATWVGPAPGFLTRKIFFSHFSNFFFIMGFSGSLITNPTSVLVPVHPIYHYPIRNFVNVVAMFVHSNQRLRNVSQN